ncbi:MAG: ribosome maturation factor RimM [Schwartzia sp.]|nr:ribosome maturation factor RimM [Schwartzia sp. (in: firmicutes)]
MTLSSQSAAKNNIVIGKIGAPHGVHGELKVVPITDYPERFKGMKKVFVDDESMDIKSVRYQNDRILMMFSGYDSREKAATLTGRMLSVERTEAVPLEEDEYYTFDILGLNVETEDGKALGRVVDVLQPGSNDVYVVESPDSDEPILIPALKSVVKKISIADGKMIVKLQEVLE